LIVAEPESVALEPAESVRVTVMLNVPAELYVWLAVPIVVVAVVPSPKAHV